MEFLKSLDADTASLAPPLTNALGVPVWQGFSVSIVSSSGDKTGVYSQDVIDIAKDIHALAQELFQNRPELITRIILKKKDGASLLLAELAQPDSTTKLVNFTPHFHDKQLPDRIVKFVKE